MGSATAAIIVTTPSTREDAGAANESEKCNHNQCLNDLFSRDALDCIHGCSPCPCRLKNWTSFSWFSAASCVIKVPRFLRFPVLGFSLMEYSRYLPVLSFRIISDQPCRPAVLARASRALHYSLHDLYFRSLPSPATLTSLHMPSVPLTLAS